MKILLDYVFPISVITPTPAASTGFLKRVCLVCKPKTGQEGNVGQMFTCNNMTAVAVRTDNTNAQQLFNAGLSQVFILLANDLDLETPMETYKGQFFTLLISDDFEDADLEAGIETPAVAAFLVKADLTFTAKTPGTGGNSISVAFLDDTTAGNEYAHASGNAITLHGEGGVSTATQLKAALDDSVSVAALISTAIASGQGAVAQAAFALDNLENGAAAVPGTGEGLLVGTFDGVIGVSSDDADFCADQVTKTNRCAFFTKAANGAKNMCFAFGSLLANPSNWLNQQYITMPVNDDVAELGDANSLFDDKVSFVISDDEFGTRLALFSVQGKAIIAPYILKNLRIDLQSTALQWISQNQPQYTIKEASLLENRLQLDVINAKYIALGWIESGTVEISLVQSNFVANGSIEVPQPKALWRVFGEMTETV